MGSFGKMLTEAGAELAEQAFKGFGRFFEKDAGKDIGGGYRGYFRSGRYLMEKSKQGEYLSKYTREVFEPAVRKTMQQRLDAARPKLATMKSAKDRQELIQNIGLSSFHDSVPIYFGKNGEVFIKAVRGATMTNGKIYGNAMADVISTYMHDSSSFWRTKKFDFAGQKLTLGDFGIKQKPRYVPPTEWEGPLRHSLSLMYTQGIAIPHLGQIVNTIMNEGVFRTARALAEWSAALAKTGSPDKVFKDILDSGILADEIRHEMLSDAKTPGGSLLDKLINHPGFNWVRRQQIVVNAIAAKLHLQDAAAELARGENVRMNTYTLNRLGIDVNGLAQRGYQLTADDFSRAMNNSTTQNMFLRSELETPWKWEESTFMRMGTQYRHWGYRQGKFMAGVLKNAYVHGGPVEFSKTLIAMGVLFPVVGEMVKDLENIAKLQPINNPFAPDKKFTDEYFSAVAHVGAFGIMHTMWRAGQMNYATGFFEGPMLRTAEDLISTTSHLVKGVDYSLTDEPDKASTQYRAAARLVVNKFGIPGRAIAARIKKAKELQ